MLGSLACSVHVCVWSNLSKGRMFDALAFLLVAFLLVSWGGVPIDS